MDALILGEWNDRRIRVNAADPDYINATDMCGACGKAWSNWLTNDGSENILCELERSLGIPRDRIVVSVTAGPNNARGTWVHRRLAIVLAQWCSPAFAVWVAEKIEQLMTTGKVVVHREHQEAELSESPQTIGILRDILHEVKEQREDHRLTVRCCFETLEAMKRAPTRKLEAAVEAQLVRTEGGQRQVPIGYNDKIDVLQKSRHVVEIKHASEWKNAAGQVTRYARQIANSTKRIHLFLRPEEKPWSDAKRLEMEEDCRERGVSVTWHEWTFEALPQRQTLLHLGY